MRRFQRVLDPEGLTVREQREESSTGRYARPFAAKSAAELSRGGYVRAELGETVFYPPDAAVLLSDEFLDQHCFRVRAGSGENRGRVGLEFEPVRGRSLPDVRGVLWLDAATSELRTLDYTFTGVRREQGGTTAWGGRLEFDHLATGGWIVRRWTLRMPQMGRRASTALGLMGSDNVSRLVSILEVGGEVTQVNEAATEPERAAVAGAVWDSTRTAAVAGARVVLEGTSLEARTAADGSFRIARVPEGRYRLTWSHPRADSLGFAPPPLEVEVGTSGERVVALAIPRRAARDTAPRGTVVLDTLTTVGRARTVALENAGFYERQRLGLGRLMSGDDFRARGGARVTDAISGIMGIFARNRGYSDVVFTQRHAGATCTVPVFLDGVPSTATELNRLPPGEVTAVEVYEGTNVPGRFILPANPSARVCGAVVVWTKGR